MPKKYDCSKTLDYAHEFERLCKTYEESCIGCPLDALDGGCSAQIDQARIDTVQRWLDEHPEPEEEAECEFCDKVRENCLYLPEYVQGGYNLRQIKTKFCPICGRKLRDEG